MAGTRPVSVPLQQAGEHGDSGALARTVRAKEAEQLPLVYLKAYATHGFQLAETLAQILTLVT
jgi:hypothetical protein